MSRLLTLLIFLGISFISCKKERDAETTTSAQHLFAESIFEEVGDIVNQAIFSQNADSVASCATLIIDSTSILKSYTIDFGTQNCTCLDGKTRQGKITFSASGSFKDSNTIINITFDKFFTNNIRIEGSKILTNKGFNNSGRMSFDIIVDTKITDIDGVFYNWICNRKGEWLAGYTTSNFDDDQYRLVSGTSTGTSSNGMTFKSTIKTALLRKKSCNQTVSGELILTPEGKPGRTINYGTGNCDNKVTVNVNGNDYSIDLY